MRRRNGFTLVEMLVSMTLTIFIMVIVSEAFVAALETFRQLKGLGDMEASLRTFSTLLRRDLAADHFEGKRRLSDAKFWQTGSPREGFFRIQQIDNAQMAAVDNQAPLAEAADADGIPCRRRRTHSLHFTVKLRGNNRQDFFTAKIDPAIDPNSALLTYGTPDARYQLAGTNTFNSQWAEVVYFLGPNPRLVPRPAPGQLPAAQPTQPPAAQPVQATANGTLLYTLYRRQRLVVPNPDAISLNYGGNAVKVGLAGAYNQVSIWKDSNPANPNPYANPLNPTKLYFNSPMSLTIPQRRFGVTTAAFAPATNPNSNGVVVDYSPLTDVYGLSGDDLLLSNVISFDVQILTAQNNGAFVDLSQVSTGMTAIPVITNGRRTVVTGAFAFDTWSNVKDEQFDYANTAVPAGYYGGNIFAIQVTARIWDPRTQQARQISVIQDM